MKWILAIVLMGVTNVLQAQPVLPNIMGAQEGNTVRLTWVCQYEGIKAITVRRSYDSLKNYTDIGSVSDPKKGTQTYVDERPVQGRSFYKVNVVFKSGLNWGSNHCGVSVDGQNVATASSREAELGEQRVKFKMTEPELDMERTFTEPVYVRINKTTGHVDVQLPADFAEHKWSLVFYNSKKQVVLNVPVIKAKNAVIDKRNFQRRGRYELMLRKDGELLEWGYVAIGI